MNLPATQRSAASQVHREYRQLADLYVESGFDKGLERRLDDIFSLRLTATQGGHQEPPSRPRGSERSRVPQACGAAPCPACR